jgi:hypothetical protein
VGDGDQDDGEPGTEEVSLGDFTNGDLVASEVSITEGFCDAVLPILGRVKRRLERSVLLSGDRSSKLAIILIRSNYPPVRIDARLSRRRLFSAVIAIIALAVTALVAGPATAAVPGPPTSVTAPPGGRLGLRWAAVHFAASHPRTGHSLSSRRVACVCLEPRVVPDYGQPDEACLLVDPARSSMSRVTSGFDDHQPHTGIA